MESIKKNLNKIIILGICIAFIPVFIFMLQFSPFKYNLSSLIEDWGTFGDYISGTVGLIINAINLIVFILLTIEIANLDSRKNEKNRIFETQKLISNLQYEAIKQFEIKVGELTDNIGNHSIKNVANQPVNNKPILWDIFKTENYFEGFLRTYMDLFPEMNGVSLQNDIRNIKNYFLTSQSNPDILTVYFESFRSNYLLFLKGLRIEAMKNIKGL